ncbi:MAG: hypothetical protein AAB509_02525 [Patescibacteria group bacterium]
MQKREFIKYIAIIIIILVIVFLSQQPYFRGYGKDIYGKVDSWVRTNVYSKVSGEVEKRGEAIKEEVNKEKNAVAQNIWDKIKNYLASVFSKSTGAQVQ